MLKKLLRPLYRRLRGFVTESLPVLYRNGMRYDRIAEEVKRIKPSTIVEIGTCRGDNAERMIRVALWYGNAEYYGFDLFEELNDETFGKEASRWPAGLENVTARLTGIKQRGRTPRVHLYKGDTTKTLAAEVEKIGKADLIFIDGGHSYETVRADWENSLKLCHPGTVVFFDDYPNWGVGRLVDEIDRANWDVEIIAPGDYFSHTTPPLNCRLARVTPKSA